ncbi:MAG: aldehyde dehydrogenase family protein [Coxiellaceae bacterium]|nr:aldehyde dehydrogenase family protein [Coxiellaceae bacterium]
MKLLQQLGLLEKNFSACTAKNGWSTTTDQGVIDSISPASGELIAQVYNCSEADYERVMETAELAGQRWRQVPAPQRGEVVRQLGDLLRQHKDALGSLVSLEMGKSKQEGDGEVQEMIDMADLAVGQSRMLYGHTMHSERPFHRMYEQWHPLGTVGVISAFNFPVAVWAWNAFVAAVCGNAVVWRPSPKTPLCTVAVQHLCNQVMEKNNCEGVFNCVISDDVELSKRFVADDRFPLVSFTGSSAVGAHVAQVVAKRYGRSLLECSGNNAMIIEPDADLDLAIPAIVFGAVGTAGQRCTTTRRLLLHKSIYDKVVTAIVAAYSKVTIGDPLDTKNLMGPLIDSDSVTQYQQAIEQARAQGGKVLCGGDVIDRPGFYVQPTLIEAQNDWDIVQQETFAPILYVMPYEELDQAIAMQNNVCQGLSSAIFTQSVKTAECFLSAMGSDCGIANVNIGTSGAEIGGAFGGEKATGGGREAGSDAWKAYMRRQTNTINWSDELPLAQGISFEL